MRERLTARAWAAPLLAALVGLAYVVLCAVAARGSSWVQDDFRWLGEARQDGLSWSVLSRDVFGSYVPAFRLMYYPIVALDGDYRAAVVAEVALAAGIAATSWRLLSGLCGPSAWIALVLAPALLSALWVPTLLWPADALHTLPYTFLTLVVLDAFVRWDRSRRRGWLALSGLAYFAALLYSNKAVVVAGGAVALCVLVLDAGRPADLARQLLARWPMWAAYVAATLAVGVMLLLGGGTYGNASTSVPDVPVDWGLIPQIVATAWGSGFAPALVGLGAPQAHFAALGAVPQDVPAADPVVVAVGQLAVVALVAVSLVRRPAAWRAWLWLALVFVAGWLVLGYARSWDGVKIGRAYRYLVDLAPLAAAAAGMAFFGVRDVAGRAPSPLGAPARPLPRALRTGLLAVLAVWLCAHLVLSAQRTQDLRAAWPGERARVWTDRAVSGLEAIRARGAQATTPVLDAPLPDYVAVSGFGGYSRTGQALETFVPGTRFGFAGQAKVAVGDDGYLVTLPPPGG